jgi:hypothetical protein
MEDDELEALLSFGNDETDPQDGAGSSSKASGSSRNAELGAVVSLLLDAGANPRHAVTEADGVVTPVMLAALLPDFPWAWEVRDALARAVRRDKSSSAKSAAASAVAIAARIDRGGSSSVRLLQWAVAVDGDDQRGLLSPENHVGGKVVDTVDTVDPATTTKGRAAVAMSPLATLVRSQSDADQALGSSSNRVARIAILLAAYKAAEIPVDSDTDADGVPVLHMAVLHTRPPAADDTAVIEALCRAGASVAARDAHGRNALHAAALTGDVEFLGALIRTCDRGGEEKLEAENNDPPVLDRAAAMRDAHGRSPIDMVATWGKVYFLREMCRLLPSLRRDDPRCSGSWTPPPPRSLTNNKTTASGGGSSGGEQLGYDVAAARRAHIAAGWRWADATSHSSDRCDIDIVSAATLTVADFVRDYFSLRRPVLIRGALGSGGGSRSAGTRFPFVYFFFFLNYSQQTCTSHPKTRCTCFHFIYTCT